MKPTLIFLMGPDSALNGPRSALSQASPAGDFAALTLMLLVVGGMIVVLAWMIFFRGKAKPMSPTVRAEMQDQPLPASVEERPRA